MEIKQASVKEQAALQPLWEFATQVPPGTPIGLGYKVLTAEEVSKIPPGTRISHGIPKMLTVDELWAILAPSSAGSKQTRAGQVAVAVGLSAEDLSDPTRIQSLLAGMRQHPDKAAAAVNLVTGTGQNICDAIKLQYPTFTPAVAGPVAGLAIIGSSANFWQEMHGDDTVGKVMKITTLVANTVEFLTITGIIPDGGTPLRIGCIAVRSADAAYDKVRKINEPGKPVEVTKDFSDWSPVNKPE